MLLWSDIFFFFQPLAPGRGEEGKDDGELSGREGRQREVEWSEGARE